MDLMDDCQEEKQDYFAARAEHDEDELLAELDDLEAEA